MNAHGLVDFLDGQIAVDILHGLSGRLHGVEGFLVDVGGFDAVYLLLDLADLVVGLLEAAFVDFFPPYGIHGG